MIDFPACDEDEKISESTCMSSTDRFIPPPDTVIVTEKPLFRGVEFLG